MAKSTADDKKNKKADKKNKKKRRSPIAYFRDMISELKKVTWPTRKELVTYTVTVVTFVIIFAAIVGGLDWIFAQGLALITK